MTCMAQRAFFKAVLAQLYILLLLACGILLCSSTIWSCSSIALRGERSVSWHPAACRRERAELAAGGPSDSDATPAAAYDGADGYANGGTPQRSDGLARPVGSQPPFVSMLKECRSVDEYEKLTKISGEAMVAG